MDDRGQKKFQEHFSINHGEFFPLAIWNAFLYFFKKSNVCINNLVGMGCKPRWDDHGNHYWWFLRVKQSVPQNLECVICRWVTAKEPHLSHLHESLLLHLNGYLSTQYFWLSELQNAHINFSSAQISAHIDTGVVLLIWLCYCFDKILLRTLLPIAVFSNFL